jgi:hypothetical protein
LKYASLWNRKCQKLFLHIIRWGTGYSIGMMPRQLCASVIYIRELSIDELSHMSLIILGLQFICFRNTFWQKWLACLNKIVYFSRGSAVQYKKGKPVKFGITWRRFWGSSWMVFLCHFMWQECMWCARVALQLGTNQHTKLELQVCCWMRSHR